MSRRGCVLVFAVLVAFLGSVMGDIVPLRDDVLDFESVLVIGSNVMFAPEDAPAKSSPGHGLSFIQPSLTFTVPNAVREGTVSVVVFRGTSADVLGAEKDGDRFFCCTEEAVKAGVCGQDGLDKPIVTGDHWVTQAEFDNSASASITLGPDGDDNPTRRYHVKHTGYYTVALANCDHHLRQEVGVFGNLIFMNPYGYLSGLLYPFLPFYKTMATLFLLVAVVWLGSNALYWRHVMPLQNFISGVFFLCLVEMGSWYFAYKDFNNEGFKSNGTFVFGILVSVTRRTVSRMLVLSVALGYAVVRPTLGDDAVRIAALGIVYFICEAVLELYSHASPTGGWRLLFTLPVALLDAIVFWWIFLSLCELTVKLSARRQIVKLNLYKLFTRVLVVAVLLAFVAALYQTYYISTNQVVTENGWQYFWLLEAGFWQILYSGVLLVIMVLWRPSKNSRRFAYAEVATVEEEDYGMVEMEDLHSGTVVARAAAPQKPTRNVPLAENPVFEIGDEEEEGVVAFTDTQLAILNELVDAPVGKQH